MALLEQVQSLQSQLQTTQRQLAQIASALDQQQLQAANIVSLLVTECNLRTYHSQKYTLYSPTAPRPEMMSPQHPPSCDPTVSTLGITDRPQPILMSLSDSSPTSRIIVDSNTVFSDSRIASIPSDAITQSQRTKRSSCSQTPSQTSVRKRRRKPLQTSLSSAKIQATETSANGLMTFSDRYVAHTGTN